MPAFRKPSGPITSADFYSFSHFEGGSASPAGPFVVAAISGGSISDPDSSTTISAANPGVARIRSVATVNSGGRIMTSIASKRLRGNDYFESTFKLYSVAGLVGYMGFHNSVSATAPTAGAYLAMAGNIVTARCISAGSTSNAALTYALPTGLTDYVTARIYIDSALSLITFEIWIAGTRVWQQMISTNIPTALLGSGVVAINSGTAQAELFNIDAMGVGTVAGYYAATKQP